LANYISWAARFYGSGLVFPLFTPLTFDLTITSIFVPLASGGSIVAYPATTGAADLAVLEGTKETKMYPVTTYIAIQFIAEAVRKAGSADPQAMAKALVGLSVETPLGTRTIDPDNHRTNTGEFWGPMVTVEGSEAKQMSPATYLE